MLRLIRAVKRPFGWSAVLRSVHTSTSTSTSTRHSRRLLWRTQAERLQLSNARRFAHQKVEDSQQKEEANVNQENERGFITVFDAPDPNLVVAPGKVVTVIVNLFPPNAPREEWVVDNAEDCVVIPDPLIPDYNRHWWYNLLGMRVGEGSAWEIPPVFKKIKSLVTELEVSRFHNHEGGPADLKPGMMFFDPRINTFATILEVHGDRGIATVDMNHPFAEKTFHITYLVVDIRDATGDELLTGVASGSQKDSRKRVFRYPEIGEDLEALELIRPQANPNAARKPPAWAERQDPWGGRPEPPSARTPDWIKSAPGTLPDVPDIPHYEVASSASTTTETEASLEARLQSRRRDGGVGVEETSERRNNIPPGDESWMNQGGWKRLGSAPDVFGVRKLLSTPTPSYPEMRRIVDPYLEAKRNYDEYVKKMKAEQDSRLDVDLAIDPFASTSPSSGGVGVVDVEAIINDCDSAKNQRAEARPEADIDWTRERLYEMRAAHKNHQPVPAVNTEDGLS